MLKFSVAYADVDTDHGWMDAWLNTISGARAEHQGVPADKKFPNMLLVILYRESEL